MIRFTPARTYLTASAVAFGLAAFSGWGALTLLPAAIPAVLLFGGALFGVWLGIRPAIIISDTHLVSGKLQIAWEDIRRIDQTGWISPMVADLTLADGSVIRLLYPGETEQSNRLLRLIQQRATQSVINGVPYSQIFGEPEPPTPPPAPPKEAQAQTTAPRYRLLTEEDEAEVERLYQKLRTAGHLDPEK